MAGSYYDQDRTKRLLEIGTGDSADDTIIDELGLVADQHLDNILKIHDEKIPQTGSGVDNVMKEMAALYTASIFKDKRKEFQTADVFRTQFNVLLEGLALGKAVEGVVFTVPRFNSRYQTGLEHEYALW